jgi:hypothetical protein
MADATDDVTTDLPPLDDTPLTELAEHEPDAPDTLRRVAPSDGTRLLVAASFNSAI